MSNYFQSQLTKSLQHGFIHRHDYPDGNYAPQILINKPAKGAMSSPLFKTNCLSVIVSTSLWPLFLRLGLLCLRPNCRIWLIVG